MTLTTKTLAQLARLNSGIGPVPQYWIPVANNPSGGTITAVAVASLVDGETFALNDGINVETVFEFDVAGNGALPGRVNVDVSSLTTADEVKAAIIAAINLVPTSTLGIRAVSQSTGVALLIGQFGDVGNVTPSADTVVDAGFVVTAMTGGVDYPSTIPSTDGAGVDVSEVSRAVISITPVGADVVFSVVSRTTGTSNKFEPLNNLETLTARADIGWKEIVNVGSESEIAIYLESGSAPIEAVAIVISPCTGA